MAKFPFKEILEADGASISSNLVGRSKNLRRTTQSMLGRDLRIMFPEEGEFFILLFYLNILEICEEFKHPEITGNFKTLELDFFFPRLNLAFEYQVTHYLLAI